MSFLTWGMLTFGVTFIALTNGRSPVSFTTSKSVVNVGKKGVSVSSGGLLFSVYTCKQATVLLSSRKDTLLKAPEYKLVINDKMGFSSWRTVLYHMDDNSNTHQPVMVITQTENLCDNSHWLFLQYKKDFFAVGDFCNRKNTTFLLSGLNNKALISTASVYGQKKAKWIFARDNKVKCTTKTGEPFKDFLHLQSVTQKQKGNLKPWIISNNLFDFTSSKKLKVTVKTCQNVYIIFSSNEKFTDYFFLMLENEKRNTRRILLQKRSNNKYIGIGSSLESVDFCDEARTMHVYWSNDRIGIGMLCDQSSGKEWKIDSKTKLQYVAVSSKGNESTQWNVSTVSCDVRYNQDENYPSKKSLQVSPRPEYTYSTASTTAHSATSPGPYHTLSTTGDAFESSSRGNFSENPTKIMNSSADKSRNKDSGRNIKETQKGEGTKVKSDIFLSKVILLCFVVVVIFR